jgi:hypothetical protein
VLVSNHAPSPGATRTCDLVNMLSMKMCTKTFILVLEVKGISHLSDYYWGRSQNPDRFVRRCATLSTTCFTYRPASAGWEQWATDKYLQMDPEKISTTHPSITEQSVSSHPSLVEPIPCFSRALTPKDAEGLLPLGLVI